LGNLGTVYLQLGEYQTALDPLQQALSIAREIGDRQHECEWLNQLGEYHTKTNNTRLARESLDHSLSISSELRLPELQARGLFNLAKLSELNGYRELALQHAQDARQIFEALESPEAETVHLFVESLKD
jgi:tetratricopeptide (TPR) repeat protein